LLKNTVLIGVPMFTPKLLFNKGRLKSFYAFNIEFQHFSKITYMDIYFSIYV